VSDLPTKKKHGGLNTSSARLYTARESSVSQDLVSCLT